jgi:hypothetical protein
MGIIKLIHNLQFLSNYIETHLPITFHNHADNKWDSLKVTLDGKEIKATRVDWSMGLDDMIPGLSKSIITIDIKTK